MQALVINMKKSLDRWDFMAKQLEELGINYKRLEAYDVSSMGKDTFTEYSESWERPLRVTEVGCFLSHKSAWQIVARENKPYMIFEDDVILIKDIKEVAYSFNASENYDLINLETTPRLKLLFNAEISINQKFTLRKLLHNKTGAAAYIIWPSFAKKLLSKYSGQSAALADAALYTNFFKSKQFQLVPSVAVQLQYSDTFNIKNAFKPRSNIAQGVVPKSFKFRYIRKRLKTQLCIIIVQFLSLCQARYIKVDICRKS